MDKLKFAKVLLLIAAAVSAAAWVFTKNEVNQYACFSILMLLFGINATEDYAREKEKKRFSLFLAILCYAICLLQLVLLAGTLIQS